MDGCLILPFNNHAHFRMNEWESITVDYEHYDDSVYSLSVSHENLYVADSIATHNCQSIYGFAGSDTHSFENVMKTFNCKVLPLSFCYRCGKSIVKEAQQIVPEIESPDFMHEGEILYIEENKLIETVISKVDSHDVILCRNNAPLITWCLEFISNGKKAKVLGRKVGESIETHARKIAKMGEWQFFLEFTEKYRYKEVDKITSKPIHYQGQIDFINDLCDCIIAIHSPDLNSIEQFCQKVDTIFTDTEVGLLLSTSHKAKGKEWDRVFVIKPELYAKRRNNQSDDQYQQEVNLLYVTITRAKKALVWVTD